MVRVKDYKALWEYIRSTVKGIDYLFMVDDEAELTNKIKSISDGDANLVIVFPTTYSTAYDEDNIPDVDSCVIFILQKISEMDVDEADLMNQRENTQDLLTMIRASMYALATDHANDDNHHIMHKMIAGKQHIDRERNYLWCNGWSLSFSLVTDAFSYSTLQNSAK
jgi:hypothetical protein